MRISNVTKAALVTAAALTLALPGAAMARGGGAHGGMSMSMGVGAGMGMGGGSSAAHISASGMTNTNGPNASDREFGGARATLRHEQHATDVNATTSTSSSTSMMPNGGQSSAHISASGLANTNGPNASDRQTGKARATQRSQMNNSSSTPQH